MTQGPGAGWWLARDGRWYPPELHPSVLNGDTTVSQLTASAQAAAPDRVAPVQTQQSESAQSVEPVAQAEPAPAAEPPSTQSPEADQAPSQEPTAQISQDTAVEGTPTAYVAPAQAHDVDISSAPSGPSVENEPSTYRQAGGESGFAGQLDEPEIRVTVSATQSDEWDLPPEKPGRMLMVAIVIAAVVLALIAAFSFINDGGEGNASPGVTSPPDTIGLSEEFASDLAVGSCVNDIGLASRDQVTDIAGIDCLTPHTHEVFAQFDVDAVDEYSIDDVRVAADEGCLAEAGGYIGSELASTDYEVLHFSPNRAGWNAGDRSVTCLLYNPLEEVTSGSVAGTGLIE